MIRVAVVTALALAASGCGATTSERDCISAWNAAGNAANRERVAGAAWQVEVSRWRAQAAGGGASEGCSFFFYDDVRWLSISGEWRGGRLRWNVPPAMHGRRTAQQRQPHANAQLARDGTLRR